MKIAIAGYGYVGKAVHGAAKRWHQTMVIDPGYEEFENNKIDDSYEGIVICVSTFRLSPRCKSQVGIVLQKTSYILLLGAALCAALTSSETILELPCWTRVQNNMHRKLPN